ncbi:probable protein S-acyltransferase 7 isoform X2 [Musa acuminata AAA Group]|uniref:probable protein S-acyltransferase 7 isoform X2 n=1 Tax=Musa acuminata AAA Group TaxID=214697 RepID=UPI0008A0F0FD|nr:PREDICTED: probable protein S-acyltransferase 7 isoform X2 [Musa acuminata subsp. malaccensis]
MYVVPPPRGPDLAAAGAAGAEAPRVYQVWKGSNIFFLQGRFIFGPDGRSLFLTIFMIVAPVSIFCALVAKKLMDDFSTTLGLPVMVAAIVFTLYDLTLLLLASGRDPGIVPRNAHPPEPEIFEGNTEIGGVRTPQLRLPRTKDVNVNGIIVKVKYCDTCMLYRPPRCSHCSICNNCVERFDHHCPWVGQCIGLTTYENFRYRYDRRANPYDRGVVKNFKEIFFTSIPPSKNKFRARVPQEQRFQPRSTGGGFMSPNMGKAVSDIEMGRKPVTWDELRAITQIGDLEEGLHNANIEDDKVRELGEASTDLSREAVSTRSMEVQAALHDRRSSWGRGGSWERTYELQPVEAARGETNRMASGNGSSNIATGN